MLLQLLEKDIVAARARRFPPAADAPIDAVQTAIITLDPAQMLSPTVQLMERLQFAQYICTVSPDVKLTFEDLRLIWQLYITSDAPPPYTPTHATEMSEPDTVFTWMEGMMNTCGVTQNAASMEVSAVQR